MTDRLTHVLGEISALTVISSMSAMRYKDSIKPLPEIARELGVDAFVEGAIMRAGEQVRITLRLVHGPTDTPVWSEEYVEEVGDVLDLQRRVSQDVAERIQLVLAPADLTRFAQPIDSPDPQAYEAYLRGRHHLIRWSGKDAATAILNFEEAIALDPAFAPAHAALAEICTLSRAFGPSSAYELEDCEDFVHRALALDPDHADAHYALGMVRSARWDWGGAETSFRRAIELNPNSAMARLWYGWFLSQLMRHDESLLESQRAESLDPLNPFVKVMVAQSLMDDHRYDEGLAKTSEALSLDPNYGVAHIMESAFYALKGMPREARESAQKAVNRMGEDDFMVLMLTAWSYAQEGREDRAREILARIDALYAGPNAGVATVYLALGQEEEAFEILERAYLARSQWLPNWTVQTNFDSIRDQPRFQILRRNMGLER
jgi:Tfp pilus assembly protein PilF